MMQLTLVLKAFFSYVRLEQEAEVVSVTNLWSSWLLCLSAVVYQQAAVLSAAV